MALELPAFPGAKGFGATTTHGRGGRVIEVTNTHSEGPGSLREACQTPGPRIIVFHVGGMIRLHGKPIRIAEPYCYIAGQTAPGDGICIRDAQFVISAHDVLVRHLRVRPGDDLAGSNPNGRTGIVIGRQGYGRTGPDEGPGDIYNTVVDHCSVSWSPDKNVASGRTSAAASPSSGASSRRRSTTASALTARFTPAGTAVPFSSAIAVARSRSTTTSSAITAGGTPRSTAAPSASMSRTT